MEKTINKKKICHFLPWYSPANKGGTEIYILNLSKQLIEYGYDVLIICPSKTTVTEYIKVNGIDVIASTAIQIFQDHKVDMGYIPPAGIFEFELLLKSIKPDVLHFHSFWRRNIYYLEKAYELKIKTFITPHLALFSCLQMELLYAGKTACDGIVEISKCSSCLIKSKTSNKVMQKTLKVSSSIANSLKVYPGVKNKLFRSLNIYNEVESQINIFGRINESVNSIITISNWYYDVLFENKYFDKQKIKLIPTSLNNHQRLSPEKKKTKRLQIAFIGRQSHEKGIHLLLEAVTHILPAFIEIHILGKKIDKTYDDKIATLLAAGYLVHQYGEIPHDVAMKKLILMDILCVPSVSIEMSPLVVHEALAIGVPVIGANRGGIKDLINDGVNGLLFKYNDSKDLSDKIKFILTDNSILKDLNSNSKVVVGEHDFVESHVRVYESG